MTSPLPTSVGSSMEASGITAEIKALAMSGQENFVPAAEEANQEASHSFLSLAPKTSAGYPVAAQLSGSSGASTPRELVDPDQARAATGADELGQKKVGDGNSQTKGLCGIDAEKELVKASRSESMSSEASNGSTSNVSAYKGMSSKRFLKLVPVHVGEAALGDWSEEVVE
ncbi:hypothetical protein DSL72_004084 [Monilinia vaccinii-corymbosi]|uniref:Uncharacterized protein n=1 Tax=Monilinia vaccinii-corymbosi TaxID=61207 RepID=A0A8A3P8H6_9HELO|nr:hypothetical protein DSL72_004084 [Monilinia vaccinii-corymbosi]